MSVVDNTNNGDDYSDGEDGWYTLADISSDPDGPVPSPFRVTPDGSWVLKNSNLESVAAGRCTYRFDVPFGFELGSSQLLSLPLGSADPFCVLYDVTDAGGVGPHAYLTATSIEFNTFSMPLPGRIATTPDTQNYFGSQIVTYSQLFVVYDSDTQFTVNYFGAGYFRYSTFTFDNSRTWALTVDLPKVHGDHPAEPDQLPWPLHAGFTAPGPGCIMSAPAVLAEGSGWQQRQPRFDL